MSPKETIPPPRPPEKTNPLPETPETRREAFVQEIRRRYQILVISTQQSQMLEDLNLDPKGGDWIWFRDALNIPSDQIRHVHAPSEKLPDTLEASGIVVLGSSHAVYEKDQPWIQNLEALLRTAREKEIDILGICFGHQLVGQAFGGAVEQNPQGLVFGTFNVDLTEAGAVDPLFQGIEKTFEAQEVHGDIVTQLPPGAQVLAQGKFTAIESIAVGEFIRTAQFHPELTPEVVRQAAQMRRKILEHKGLIYEGSDEDFARFQAAIKATPVAQKVLRNFLTNFVEKHAERKG